MKHYLYAARFQPFHNDHLAIIEHFIKKNTNDVLTLCIVRNIEVFNSNCTLIQKDSKEHLQKDRNPFSATQNLLMINNLISNKYKNRINVILIAPPSQEVGWNLIESFFPTNRIWFLPERDEMWDKRKEDYYLSKKDNIEKVVVTRTTSGKILREFIVKKDIDSMKKSVPIEILDIMKELL